MKKVVPISADDSKYTLPLSASTICFTIASPKPVPVVFVVKLGSNIFFFTASCIPHPLSKMETLKKPPFLLNEMFTFPFPVSSIAWIALFIILLKTLTIWSKSPLMKALSIPLYLNSKEVFSLDLKKSMVEINTSLRLIFFCFSC